MRNGISASLARNMGLVDRSISAPCAPVVINILSQTLRAFVPVVKSIKLIASNPSNNRDGFLLNSASKATSRFVAMQGQLARANLTTEYVSNEFLLASSILYAFFSHTIF